MPKNGSNITVTVATHRTKRKASWLVDGAQRTNAGVVRPYKHGNTPYDPTRHMPDNGLQKHRHALRKAPGLPRIAPHVLRYQCITKMAEAGIDRVNAKCVAGHITDQMWDKCNGVRFDSIREKMPEALGTSPELWLNMQTQYDR
jgi:integrase